MVLTPTQAEVAQDRHRFRVLRCGRRWGKTTLSAEEIKGYAIFRESRIAYIANTYQQARDILWQTLKNEMRPVTVEVNESRLELIVRNQLGTTSTIVLRGWESVDTLRGQSFDFLVLDEVASMRNFWLNWQEVLRPTLTDRKGAAMFLGTPKGYNHFYDLSNLELTDTNWKSFHYTSYDNVHLDPEEIDAAKASTPADRFGQEYLAQFHKAEGLVYKEFMRDRNTYETLPEGKFVKVAGLDFGYTNPAALLDIYTDGEAFYVEEEWYKTGRTDAQIAEYARAQVYEGIYPDPENASGVEELRQQGLNVREVIKGKGSVERGIQKVRELLLNGKLKVNKKCKAVIGEFESYSYPEEDGEKNANEIPIKKGDHAMDALRYVVMMRAEISETKPYVQPAYVPVSEFEAPRHEYDPFEDEFS